MTPISRPALPDKYLWLEDVATVTKVEEAILLELCRDQYIQSMELNGRWAIHVLNIRDLVAGDVIVRDLKAGGNITIGDIVKVYSLPDSSATFGRQAMEKQKPVREKIDAARKWVYISWYLLAGGAVFALVGIVLTWPLAAIASIPAWLNASAAAELAHAIGDRAVISDAQHIKQQALTTAMILWGTVVVFACFLLGL